MDILDKKIRKYFSKIIDDEIVFFLKKNRLKKALEELLNFPLSKKTAFKSDVELLLSRLSGNAKKNEKNEIDNESYNIELNQIRFASLNLIDEIKQDSDLIYQLQVIYQYSPVKLVKKTISILVFIIIVFYSFYYINYQNNLDKEKAEYIGIIEDRSTQINNVAGSIVEELNSIEETPDVAEQTNPINSNETKFEVSNLKKEITKENLGGKKETKDTASQINPVNLNIAKLEISNLKKEIVESNREYNDLVKKMKESIADDNNIRTHELHTQIHTIPRTYGLAERTKRVKKMLSQFELLFIEFEKIEEEVASYNLMLIKNCMGCKSASFEKSSKTLTSDFLVTEKELLSTAYNEQDKLSKDSLLQLFKFNEEIIFHEHLNYETYISIIQDYKHVINLSISDSILIFSDYEKSILINGDTTDSYYLKQLKMNNRIDTLQVNDSFYIYNHYEKFLDSKVIQSNILIRQILRHKIYDNFIRFEKEFWRHENKDLSSLEQNILLTLHQFILMSSLETAGRGWFNPNREYYTTPFKKLFLKRKLKYLLKKYSENS